MKLTAALLTLAFLQVQAHGLGQQVTLDVKEERLEKVLSLIEKQTGYVFFTPADLIRKAHPVTIKVKNEALTKVLDLCLKDQALDYVIDEKTISVVERKVGSASPQHIPAMAGEVKVDVSGRVVDEKGEPVQGATVMVKGSTQATATNEKGEFKLEGIEDKATLVITGINIETYEVKVRGREILAVKVQTKVAIGEAVTVTVNTGYQEIPRERATGSFVKIDNTLLNRRVSVDVLSRLEGIASGLLFDQRAENPLGISIRGRSTIFANTQPLVIVDNFPFSGDINAINPNDVQDISILKDAAAASIWGAYSGNGVIVITTKKGKFNQSLKVEANVSLTIGTKPDLFTNKQFLKSSDYIEVEKYLFDKGYFNIDLTNTSTWPVISPVVEILSKVKNGTLAETEANTTLDRLSKIDVRTQYNKHLYREYAGQQYALNISGGSSKINYYLSGGLNKDISNVIGNNGYRITFTSSASFKPIEKLEINARMVYASTNDVTNGFKTISAGGRYSNNIYPYAELADENGNPLQVTKDYRRSFVDNPTIKGLLNWKYIPLNERKYVNYQSKGLDNRILFNARYKIIQGLSIEGTYQYQRSSAQGISIKDVNSYEMRNLINLYSTIRGTSVSKQNIPAGGYKSVSLTNTTASSGRAQLNYSNNFNNQTVSAIIGIDFLETKTDGSNSGVYGYDPYTGSSVPVNYDTRYTLYPTGAAYIPNPNSLIPQKLNRSRSYFANASYNYLGKYTISGSARLDQSNLFGVKTNQKTVPLWSAGFKWDLDREKYFKISWIESLKLRATYGLNGNVDRSLTALTIARYSNGGGVLSSSPYAEIINPGNPQLRWERSAQLNFGIDFSLLKNQIFYGSIDFFSKKGIDLIGDRIIPSSTGFELARGNYSNMTGWGYDITLNTKLVNGKFSWLNTVLVSHARNKITQNEGNTGKVIGRPVSSLFSYHFGGLDTNGDPLGYYDNKLTKDYNAIITAGSANIETKEYNGSAAPTYFGSFRNTFYYRGLSFSFNITFKSGYYFRRSSISYSNLFTSGAGHEDYNLRWKQPGDEAHTSVPALVYIDYPQFSNRDYFYTNSSILVEKGDYIRLQDISLSYDLPLGIRIKNTLKSFQFYFYANNLGILWKANKHGIDPDNNNSLYPNPRTYSIGVRIGM